MLPFKFSRGRSRLLQLKPRALRQRPCNANADPASGYWYKYAKVGPYWFVARYHAFVYRIDFQNPYNYPALFQAYALILQTPRSELTLHVSDGVPVLRVEPKPHSWPVTRCDIYYSVDPDPRARFWRSATRVSKTDSVHDVADRRTGVGFCRTSSNRLLCASGK